MMQPNEDERRQFQEMRQAFTAQLPGQLDDMRSACEMLGQAWEAETAQRLWQTAHKIAGRGLALGFAQVGVLAQEIELITKDLIQDRANGAEPGQRGLAPILEATRARLETIYTRIQAENFTSSPVTVYSSAQTIDAVRSVQDTRSGRMIYLVDDDPLQRQELGLQIGYFGYALKTFSSPAELEKAVQSEVPSAILMDIIFPEGEQAGADIISSLSQKLASPVPVIFMSVRDDIISRLKAARAGGKAFFSKPVNIGAVIDTLDRLLEMEDIIPYRILIVDDDYIQANISALHLRKAGMEIEIVTKPLEIFQSLEGFNPDLILLDMYMPDCTGMELAVIIRQIEAFVSIPIVFLSAETDREKQLEAVGMGGDDFLTKPIKPSHLIASVTSRVERYRQLRFLMLRDSLTGLLNHTTLKERFSQEANRSIRQNRPMTYAMLDLDNFKKVNDNFGHAAGDRVIKNLSQMLSKRLRSTDIIGRYGGEEFAVVFPNTPGQQAVRILDELRAGFERVHHRSGEAEFSVTFSGGVASYPECGTPFDLAEAADRALYSAKQQGRNKVVFAE